MECLQQRCGGRVQPCVRRRDLIDALVSKAGQLPAVGSRPPTVDVSEGGERAVAFGMVAQEEFSGCHMWCSLGHALVWAAAYCEEVAYLVCAGPICDGDG
eukprot:1564901-Pyramimonas_sp.AAC.1